MRIESMRVQNYKVLRDVTLRNVSPMAVLLGANGSGKSTLLDVFAFLRDCVQFNVSEAVGRRGGYRELVSRDASGKISIEVEVRLTEADPPLAYEIVLDCVEDTAFIFRESLTKSQTGGRPPIVLFQFNVGVGDVRIDTEGDELSDVGPLDSQSLESTDIPALKGLGQINRYSTVSSFRRIVEEWHHSSIRSKGASPGTDVRLTNSLSGTGENLEGVAYYLYDAHRSLFNEVVRKMQRQVPGLKDVQPYVTEDRRVILRFADGSFKDAFPARAVSEGTVKLFALLLMLHEFEPHPLLTVEEPENDLYPQIVRPLAEEFRAYAERGSQVFVSTHSPDFVNALNLDELYWMEKRDGFAHVVHAKDDPNLVAQHVEGELLGSLWREGMFGKADPL